VRHGSFGSSLRPIPLRLTQIPKFWNRAGARFSGLPDLEKGLISRNNLVPLESLKSKIDCE
jgi:hypothetical protein